MFPFYILQGLDLILRTRRDIVAARRVIDEAEGKRIALEKAVQGLSLIHI